MTAVDMDGFWALIEESRAACGDDAETQIDFLTDHLAKGSLESVIQFHEALDVATDQAFSRRLWSAYCVISDYASDDAFQYFLCWLVLHGKEAFERVVADSDALADIIEYPRSYGAETLAYAPSYAYERATGRDDFYEQMRTHEPLETPTHTGLKGRWVHEEDWPRRFPRLWALRTSAV